MERLKTLARRRPVQIGAGVAAAVLIGGGAFLGLASQPPAPTASPAPTATSTPSPSPRPTASPSASPSPTPEPTPEIVGQCPLNGLPIYAGQEISPVALALQVENHPQARPTRNLGQADMVVEATVEGDVTRFTAIFQCNTTIGITGPVRSARYYDLDLWQDLQVLLVFFGGQAEARNRFDAAGMPYVNGIYGQWPGGWFFRSGTNPAPHNLYVNVEEIRSRLGNYAPLDAVVARAGTPHAQFSFDPQVRITDAGHAVSGVEIRTNAYWRIGWTWDPSSGQWLRSDGGAPAVDEATGDRLGATTVVVQQVVETIDYAHVDPIGSPRRVQHMVGSGNGIIYLDGVAHAVHWSRPTASSSTSWTYAATGEPVVLPPGVLWWEIVPTYAGITEN